jgi:DNA-directed RNA polymerase subunit N (RpoN/RPB10)
VVCGQMADGIWHAFKEIIGKSKKKKKVLGIT